MTSTTSGTTETTDQHRGMPVHPVADLFPMLPEDELADLAADITERGLLQPIVLDTEGQILDGRNRYAACQIAGIEPTFTTYDGDDPEGYALAVNLARRNMNRGQQAIVISDSIERECLEYTQDRANVFGVSKEYVSKARLVRQYADLKAEVTSGRKSLAAVYPEALAKSKEKRAAESTDTQMAHLRSAAPDLADQVTEERLSLSEALAALRAREAQRESERRAAATNLRSVLTYLTSTVLKPEELAGDYADVVGKFVRRDLDYAARTMSAIAKSRK